MDASSFIVTKEFTDYSDVNGIPIEIVHEPIPVNHMEEKKPFQSHSHQNNRFIPKVSHQFQRKALSPTFLNTKKSNFYEKFTHTDALQSNYASNESSDECSLPDYSDHSSSDEELNENLVLSSESYSKFVKRQERFNKQFTKSIEKQSILPQHIQNDSHRNISALSVGISMIKKLPEEPPFKEEEKNKIITECEADVRFHTQLLRYSEFKTHQTELTQISPSIVFSQSVVDEVNW